MQFQEFQPIISTPMLWISATLAFAFPASSDDLQNTDVNQTHTNPRSSPSIHTFQSHEHTRTEKRTRGIKPGVVYQLWEDMTFLLNEPDFYMIVGGLSLGPLAVRHAFGRESSELAEIWGTSNFADNLFEPGEKLGEAISPVAASISSWSVGKIRGSRSMQEFGSDVLRTQAINGLLTVAIKGAINRTRPDGAPYSYPSGHTSSAFTTAGVVYRHFGKTWGGAAFMVATYVGLSRLQENKHYVSDVVAGGVLGSYVGLKIGGRREECEGISIRPQVGSASSGLAVSISF